MRQRRDQVGAGAILIADVGHVLENQQRAERLADRVMKRHRLQHVRMITAANVKIDFGAMAIRRRPAAACATHREPAGSEDGCC